MSHQTKQALRAKSDTVFPSSNSSQAKDLGIEFVHFDTNDNPESQHVVPLGNFISDTPLSNEEYLITRSLVAARAAK
tara:strand:- start:62 stop:292 length:231 start_codon:yes stop_codon:yes gene_type:complete